MVYSTIQPGNYDLFTFDGTVATEFTSDDSLNYNPVYSPDGNYLIYTSERSGTAHLYLVDLKAPKQHKRLTGDRYFEDQACFSPDGKYIYFVSTREHYTADIYRMPFKPEQIVPKNEIINLTKNKGSNFHPAISPKNDQMVFSSNRSAEYSTVTEPEPKYNYMSTDIYVMDLNSRNITQLTQTQDWNGSPIWSADGKQVYYYSANEKESRVHAIEINDRTTKPLTHPSLNAVSPKLMPSGRIAFTASYGGKWTIMSMKMDGTDLQHESDLRINYYGASFHPKTGQMMAYGDGQIFKQSFVNELPAALFGDIVYAKLPFGIGQFLMHQEEIDFEGSKLSIRGVRGYFPQYDKAQNKVISVKEFSKIIESDVDGEHMRTIYQTDKGAIIGLSLSSDGQQIAFAAGVPFQDQNHQLNVWTIRRDGKKLQNHTLEHGLNNTFPRYHPNKNSIVFRRAEKNGKNLYLLDLQNNDIKNLTSTKTSKIDTMPAISPQGDKVVFSSMRNGENYHLYLLELMGADTNNNPVKLTNGKVADMHPTFSPDGKWVAFASEMGGFLDERPIIKIFSPQPYGDIYAMRVEDKKIVRLTASKWENSLPDWKA